MSRGRAPTLNLRFPGGPDAAPKARHSLERLRGKVEATVLEDVSLLVSELVTNSIRHAGMGRGDTLGLDVWLSDARLRVEVSDAGEGFPPKPATPDMQRGGGWGLYLVDRIADGWGVETRRGRTSVWFEVDLSRAEASR